MIRREWIIFLFLLLAGTRTSWAYVKQDAKTLFAGHSFFIPVVLELDAFLQEESSTTTTTQIVFSGGPSGTPLALWNAPSRRGQIVEILQQGDIDLFGMPIYLGVDGDGTAQENADFVRDNPSVVQDVINVYSQWYDLALEFNSETDFYIGFHWPQLGAEIETETFGDSIDLFADLFFEYVVVPLRAKYADRSIYFINYGHVVYQMKVMFEAGELPPLENLLGPRDTSLFTDVDPGHVGTMAKQMCSFVWMRFLYNVRSVDGMDLGEYQLQTVAEILRPVVELNLPYEPNFDASTGNGSDGDASSISPIDDEATIKPTLFPSMAPSPGNASSSSTRSTFAMVMFWIVYFCAFLSGAI